MIKLRLRFSKEGPIRFIGHLDVMRYFQKVMRRAGVDIAYSEGYSPHQLMSFAQPLPAGATGEGEYLDLTIRSFSDLRTAGLSEAVSLSDPGQLQQLLTRLNDVMKEGIRVTDAIILDEHASKAMSVVSACAWRVTIRDDEESGKEALEAIRQAGSLSAVLERFLAQETVFVSKKTKNGEKTFDIRPLIYEARALNDDTLTILLKAGSEDNVRPALFMQALLSFLRKDLFLSPLAISLHRTQTYQCISENGGNVLVPLIDRHDTRRISCS